MYGECPENLCDTTSHNLRIKNQNLKIYLKTYV